MQKKIIPSLAIAFALAACGDNNFERTRKTALIDDMTRHSVSMCETGPVAERARDYRGRLEDVLKDTRYRDIKTLHDNKITICLDQRLSAQVNSTFDQYIYGIFYAQKQSGVVALWDDGRPKSQAGFWTLDAYDHGSDGLEKIAKALRKGDTPAAGQMYAGRYTYSTYSFTEWRDAEDFDKDSIRKNPVLQTPPIRDRTP